MENVIDNKNILNVIAEMSQQEIEKLTSVLQIMQKFENEKKPVTLTADEAKEQGARWLEELKNQESVNTISEKPHSIILNALINRREAKINKHEKAIFEIKEKISVRENKITNRKNKISNFEKKIEKFNSEINRLNTSSNFLQSILGGKFDGMARFTINSNNKKQKKLQNRINSMKLKIANQQIKINIQSRKFTDLNNVISDREEKINKQREKINKINDIVKMDMPHVALSYFLSERSGLSVNELNKAIENPKEFFNKEEKEKSTVQNLEKKPEKKTERKTEERQNNIEHQSTEKESIKGSKEPEKQNKSISPLKVKPPPWEIKPEASKQLENYAMFEGVEFSSGFDYTYKNKKAEYVKSSGNISDEHKKMGLADLKTKAENVLYKEVTVNQLEKLEGINFIFKRDMKNSNRFIIKFNESDKQKIETALKPPKNKQTLQR